MSLARRIASRFRTSLELRAVAGLPAPKRPIVMVQSDDWGRVGIPSLETIGELQARGAQVGKSKWDYYGLETESDIAALGELLAGFRDRDGNHPRMTANFVMANADLRRMREEGYRELRWIAITDGFPEPWSEELVPAYRANIDRGVFEPGLHGFTHFNTSEMLSCLGSDSERGKSARLLAEHDVPYLASCTPEYNFALVIRRNGERFLESAAQEAWIRPGLELFAKAFGKQPRTTCAPGYRADPVTKHLWRALGVESYQDVGTNPPAMSQGLLQLHRNVQFEPVLNDDVDIVSKALHQAEQAVSRGTPIVICTHSINYITRFVDAAERSRALLRQLISSLFERFPDLRFASAGEATDAWRDERTDWFVEPSAGQRSLRRDVAEASQRLEAQPAR